MNVLARSMQLLLDSIEPVRSEDPIVSWLTVKRWQAEDPAYKAMVVWTGKCGTNS